MLSTIQALRIGQLGLDEYFKDPESDIIYHTIDYPKSNVNHSVGTRWCQNTITFKSKWFYCRTKVQIVNRGTCSENSVTCESK
jgi:hypothetical protein